MSSSGSSVGPVRREERLALRVLVVDHVAALSGGEIALERLAGALVADACVDVVLGEDGPLVERLLDAGARVLVLPMEDGIREARKDEATAMSSALALPVRLSRTLVYAWRLRGVIVRSGADVVQTNSLKAAVYGGIAGRLARRPVVWHVRDRIAPDYLPRSAVWLVRGLSRLLPTAVVGNSAATLATLPGSSRGARAVVHDPLPAVTQPPRHDDGVFRVGVVGRLAAWKGQDVFLRAFGRAFPNGDEIAVVVGAAMFGENDFAASLDDLIGELGLDGRVEMRGFREDVPAELARLDLLVHCSVVPEPFGQVVVEGMAAGLPVIAASAGGPLEIVDDGVDGMLTTPGDVEALAAAIRRVRHDPDLASRLGERARVSAGRFSPATAAAAMRAVYDRLL